MYVKYLILIEEYCHYPFEMSEIVKFERFIVFVFEITFDLRY